MNTSCMLKSFGTALLIGLLSAPSLAAVINGDGADGTVASTSVVDTGSFAAQAGQLVTDRATVWVFQLPTLGPSEIFASADLRAMLFGQNSTGFNGDLYGLPRRASSAIQSSDFFIGALDTTPGVSLIQDNFVTTSTPGLGTPFNTNPAGDAALVAYLNAQYAGGLGAGEYVFLRVSADVNPTGDFRYDLLTANAGGATEKPLITYAAVEVPEPATMGLIAGIVAMAMSMRNRRIRA